MLPLVIEKDEEIEIKILEFCLKKHPLKIMTYLPFENMGRATDGFDLLLTCKNCKEENINPTKKVPIYYCNKCKYAICLKCKTNGNLLDISDEGDLDLHLAQGPQYGVKTDKFIDLENKIQIITAVSSLKSNAYLIKLPIYNND